MSPIPRVKTTRPCQPQAAQVQMPHAWQRYAACPVHLMPLATCPECGSPAAHAIRDTDTRITRWYCLNGHSWITKGGKEPLP